MQEPTEPTDIPSCDEVETVVGADEPSIDSLLSALTQKELTQLRRCAQFFAMGLRGLLSDRDEDDLLQTAIVRTLKGTRKLNSKKNTLFTHLIKTMRSIASHWYQRAKKAPVLIELTDEAYSVEKQAETSVKIIAEAFREDDFKDDAQAGLILQLIMEGYNPAEIRMIMGLPQDVYNAGRKRVGRKLQRLMFTRGPAVAGSAKTI